MIQLDTPLFEATPPQDREARVLAGGHVAMPLPFGEPRCDEDGDEPSVLVAEVDGEEVAEIGPGAIVGERALLEGGTRTATLAARTRARVAVIPAELVDREKLEDLSATRTG